MKYYSIIGETAVTVSETPLSLAGYIEMQGPRPTPEHIAQEDGTWLIPVPTLAELKEAKLDEISAAYNEYDLNGTTMTSFGFPIQVGQAHCTKLDGAIRFAEMTEQTEIYITDADNVTHYNISIINAKQVLIEQMTAALLAHAKKQQLRTAVEAATTEQELEIITWA